ncbi:tRNA (adenosine(37)-N6)-threonylcarbamoyltransferase complex ATPase subunit type 1 TsaE [Aestuariivirga sp.]|uniref:tRNA (adenosine(37)-N6)-threonylcarbamoyltransferase complex ATPase subunit type 1 TsaE n=1 Tax=Aestuariivirga sp. TaxID=2650926 RepID=UPI0039E70D51
MPARLPDASAEFPELTLDRMERLAADLSLFASPGMALLLEGDLGAGKSTFARAFIRALAEGAEFDIPSPTFTLVQSYDETRVPVAHADLYRTASQQECMELGLDDLLARHVLLIEWPDRLGAVGWEDRARIVISGSGATRTLSITAWGRCAAALKRHNVIGAFLLQNGWGKAKRRFLEGDASFRRYETVQQDGTHAILMDMQARPDGPPVQDGLPYSAIAHLAEDIRAVIAINTELAKREFSAPHILACDVDKGLAIIEDLGRNVYGRMMLAGDGMDEPLRAAVGVLAEIAGQEWPSRVPVTGSLLHDVPPYDLRAQLIEVDLLPSWFWPFLRNEHIPAALHHEFTALWRAILPHAAPQHPVWTLRDYHSPNLLWLPERHGIKRVGLIDTQDCVLGHPAYDLASLLEDARVDIDFAMADALFAQYCRLRGANFDHENFATAYAVLGAQRATKILGIFARLAKRDGKPGYLRHMPRVARYLARNLEHPVLKPLRAWFETHLPQVLDGSLGG